MYIIIRMASYGSNGGAGIDVENYPASGTSGIGTGKLIIGNVVNNCGVPGVKSWTQGQGIYIADANDVVQNNIVYNNSGTGIYRGTLAQMPRSATISRGEISPAESVLVTAMRRGGISFSNSVVSNNISIDNGGYGDLGRRGGRLESLPQQLHLREHLRRDQTRR